MSDHIPVSGTNHEIASWIWHHLVPKNGQANTVQGELLRAIEKLRWEAQENGNINWDEGFIILIDFLADTLTKGTALSPKDWELVREDLNRLRSFQPIDDEAEDFDEDALAYVEDDLYDRLTDYVVAFSKAHPQTIPHPPNPKLMR